LFWPRTDASSGSRGFSRADLPAARAMGLDGSPEVLSIGDEVIE
jgi:hypothetical protein